MKDTEAQRRTLRGRGAWQSNVRVRRCGGVQAAFGSVDPSKRYRDEIAEGEAARRREQATSSLVETRSGARLADMHAMSLLLDQMRDADRRWFTVEDARRFTCLLRVRCASHPAPCCFASLLLSVAPL